MLENVLPRHEVLSLARRRKHRDEFKTVKKQRLDEVLSEGWTVARRNKASVRVRRPKPRHVHLEDRVWSLCFQLGFDQLSGAGGATLGANKTSAAKRQIDVVAADDEVALAFECKSADAPTKRRSVHDYIDGLAVHRQPFAQALKHVAPSESKRLHLLVLVLWNVLVSDKERERAEDQNVLLLDESDIAYFEQLAEHLGPAARFQFLASLAPGRRMDGLKTRVPALRTKSGGIKSYTFSVRADYLLKLAFVSHRARGSIKDVDTYQRMIRKSRLKRIREYIRAGGTFPTNIVLNLKKGRGMVFERAKDVGDDQGATYGYLSLSPSYGSAWVIDGQHRLFAYSGLEEARSSFLHVVAYEDLAPSEQARMFIDINHEQKSVKRSLLQELYAELRWDSEEPRERISAVVSKCVQALDKDPASPLFGRVLLADDKRSVVRCISLNSLYSAIDQPGMFIQKEGVSFGPFWAADNDRMLDRTTKVVERWLEPIATRVPDWWALGRDEGGGLSMNDGIAITLGVLRTVCQELERDGHQLAKLEDDELIDLVEQYAVCLGDHFKSFTGDQRQEFRKGARGVQGQTAQRRLLLVALNKCFPEFTPPELVEHLENKARGTKDLAYKAISDIELALKRHLIENLKIEFADEQDEDAWWYQGVPETTRLKATQRREKERGSRNHASDHLDFIDFREIALANWEMFQATVGEDGPKSKRDRTTWMVKVNDVRNIVMHPASEVLVSAEELARLQRHRRWLMVNLGLAEAETDEDE